MLKFWDMFLRILPMILFTTYFLTTLDKEASNLRFLFDCLIMMVVYLMCLKDIHNFGFEKPFLVRLYETNSMG